MSEGSPGRREREMVMVTLAGQYRLGEGEATAVEHR